ncbi:HAD family hydrolase [Halohasta salina]|uniref:HAD family hydrolase n=1 Tax=Halohasta salina TaxID=2961621 RepID=UPI0020A5ACAB|nr:HAD family hydrolase [Halohasta salina]
MSIRGVAFDLDYTLAVTTRDRDTILQAAVDAVDGPQISREEYLRAHRQHLTRESREPVFADILDGTASDVDPKSMATAYREGITDSLEPLDGIEALVTDLRSRYRVGLLTNGSVLAQRSKIEHLGWEELFDTTLVTGELPAGKPDAAAFEALLDGLGTTAEETVYIGDTPLDDIEGATASGLYAIQVLFDGSPDRDPRADAYIERDRLTQDLPGLLDSLA